MRQHGEQRAAGQVAVADLAAAGAAQELHFADREGREVVVEHELLDALAFELFDLLRVAAVPSVTVTSACVSPRVKIAEPWVRGSTPDLDRDRPDLVEAPAVEALALLEHQLAEDLLLDLGR